MLLHTTCSWPIAFCSPLFLAAIFSFCPLASAETNGVDIDAAIAAYAQNVAWTDRSAVFGTSESTFEDTSTKTHSQTKSDFKRYRDGDRIEVLDVSTQHFAEATQTFDETNDERRLATPGMAFVLIKSLGQSSAMRPPPTYLIMARTDQMIASVFANLKVDESCGEFLEGNVFDFRLGSVGLPNAFKAARARVTAHQEMYQGHECCVLESTTDADHYAAWLARDMDYTCIRYDLLHEKLDHISGSRGVLFKSNETVCEISDVRQIEGKWIAMSGQMVTTMKRADGTGTKYSASVQRQKVLLNPDFDQMGAFLKSDIPDGAIVSFWGERNLAAGVQFQWHHGAIVPQIDDASVRKVMNNPAFAMPEEDQSGDSGNAGLWAAALALGAVTVALAAVVIAQNRKLAKEKTVSPVTR